MRPIDADKVMEEINRIGGHNLCEWETLGVKALICRQDTIDVVSREEVDRLRHSLNSYALQYGTVKDQQAVIERIKAETAREIFEEIETVMRIRVRRCVNEDGVITPLRDSCWMIEIGDYAELKKKYTEEGK